MITTAETLPTLAPPGAGLPFPERIIARAMFHTLRRLHTPTQAAALLVTQRAAIDALVAPCPPDRASRRVLIRRLRGLEDSSRYWSVWMTLDHLRIVNGAVAGTIRSLAAGQVPPGEVSTADVKPDPAVDGAVVTAFGESCEALAAAAAEAPTLRTAARYPHPWFGPLDAAAWHFMGAFHLGLHRKQVQSILRGLPQG